MPELSSSALNHPKTDTIPFGITLTTQAEIDAFATNYPGCTSLDVNLRLVGSGINNLAGLSQIKSIDGQFALIQTSVVTMEGLNTINFFGSNSRLTIASNSSLNTLSDFTGSINTGEYSGITIQNNPNLISLNGLSGITSSNSLWVNNNDSLTNLNGVENMSISGNILAIERNDMLTDITALSGNLGQFDQIQIKENPLLSSLSGIEGVNLIASDASGLSIGGNALSNLDLLSTITNAPDNLFISCPNITNVLGLSNMQGELEILLIQNNSLITNFTGLEGITGIKQELRIINNNSLQSFSGIENVQNSNVTVPSLLALITNNPQLTDISSISNIEINSLSFILLENNPLLATCSNTLICNAIDLGNIGLNSNASGCNTIPEVEKECVLNSSQNNLLEEVVIYPNPVTNTLILNYPNENIEASIFSFNGKLILKSSSKLIDVSNLSSGIYFLKLESEEAISISKFIKA